MSRPAKGCSSYTHITANPIAHFHTIEFKVFSWLKQGRTEGVGAPGALTPGATIRGRKIGDFFCFNLGEIGQVTITGANKIEKKKFPTGSVYFD